MADIETTNKKRSKLTGKDNYSTWSVSTEIALKKLKAWKIIKGEIPVSADYYNNNIPELDAAYREWLLETYKEEEVTVQKVISNRKKFKKHLVTKYEQWEELNRVALSEIYDSYI